MRDYYVYMVTNKSRKSLYTGVTNDLLRRMCEHRQMKTGGFTKKYRTIYLVYFEMTGDIDAAIAREKQIKGWLRSKKNVLIETVNPYWRDLFPDIAEDPSLRSG